MPQVFGTPELTGSLSFHARPVACHIDRVRQESRQPNQLSSAASPRPAIAKNARFRREESQGRYLHLQVKDSEAAI